MKDIKGYEGLYAVTSCGRIWSYRRKMFLKPVLDGHKYLTVKLSKNGVQTRFKIHRLVAEAYIPNPLGLSDVNHKNEDKSKNYINNLEWMSHADNCNYGSRNQRISETKMGKIKNLQM